MVTKPLSALKKPVILPLALATMILAAGGPFGRPVVDAQGPPLEAQHRRLLPLFELAGVVFTDADETRGRLVIGVLDRGAEGLIRARLATLGVASQLVDVVETEAIVPVATLRDKVRPVEGGLQIRFTNYLCSLGFIAQRDGVMGYVTASHCSTTQGSVDSTQYYQPLNQNADEVIGTEIADPSFFRNTNGCPRGRKCRFSDANFSQGAGNVSFSLGLIAHTDAANSTSLTIGGTFGISGEGTASSGQTADKVGRTTGWTRGTVTNTCADTGVSGTNIVLLCQTFVEGGGTIVGSGDSGSPVFRSAGGDNVTLLGGLWGGNQSGTMFVYSPIANIERELGALQTN
jgi:hypothetical protein